MQIKIKTKHLFLALGVLAIVSCGKENMRVPSEENGYDCGYGYVGGYESMNINFEEDWASQKEISLVISSYKENEKLIVKTIDVPLPWAWDFSPYQWLPGETARNMVEFDADDWDLAFNLTGIAQKPGEHYFGLYNRYTGILRVFYYLTEDRVPQSDANDHMWTMKVSKDLIEHAIFQYAIPYGETVPENYKTSLGGNDAVFRTTALTSECSDQGKVVPKMGWWAYDIDLSPMRPHDFFGSDRSLIRPGMENFNQDNVVLNSLMHGSLDGTFDGAMNLNSLKGSSTTTGGVIGGNIGSFLNSVFTDFAIHRYIFYDGKDSSMLMSLFGAVFGFCGKGIEYVLQEDAPDPDKLGEFNGKINLSLDATIETVGTIGGERTTLVPSPDLNVQSFLNKDSGLGSGVWNIEHHPVIYVVQDAFWGDKAKFSSVEKVTSEGRDAYQLTLNPDDVGLRLISFYDPTSIGQIYLNPDALPEGAGDVTVHTSSGVLNASTPGYTNGFRHAVGLDYETPELTPKETYQSDDPDVGFRIIKKSHSDPIFLADIPEDQQDVLDNRLSQQMLGQRIHRRMFGASAFYLNKNAGPNDVDDVTMVTDPAVFLPTNSEDRLLFPIELPDYIVSAVMTCETPGPDDEKEGMVHSLRFIPKIQFIKSSELTRTYNEIKERRDQMVKQKGVVFPDLDKDIAKIKEIIDNVPR